jgi:hypothetical protein
MATDPNDTFKNQSLTSISGIHITKNEIIYNGAASTTNTWKPWEEKVKVAYYFGGQVQVDKRPYISDLPKVSGYFRQWYDGELCEEDIDAETAIHFQPSRRIHVSTK